MNPLDDVLSRIRRAASARAVLLLDEDGSLVAGESEDTSPSETLRHLWIERLGGADGLSQLVDSPEFAILVDDVPDQNVLIAPLKNGRILCVVFDQTRTSLGLVRLRVKEHRTPLILALHGGDDDG